MSEYDDFAVEEQQASSPFLPLAGLLLAILVLTVLCAGIVYLVRGPGLGGDGVQDEAFNTTSTAIAIANATTIAQNEGVTATLLALTEEATEPTATETPQPATATEEPTTPPTVGPSDTPVVIDVDETDEPVVEGTGIFENGDQDVTSTPIPSTDGNDVSGGSGETLPETGFGIAQIVAIAVGLLLVFVVARRLRTG